MSKELVISATPHETRVAILEEGQLCEIYVEREKEFALVGSIYKGRVTRVLPGMQSAFVEIGLDSDAFLYVSDFMENLEEFDIAPAPVEAKVEKMEEQGGASTFVPASGESAAMEPPDVSSHAPVARESSSPQSSELDAANSYPVNDSPTPESAAQSSTASPAERSDSLPGEVRSGGRGEYTPTRNDRGGFGRDRGRFGKGDRGRGGFGRDQGRGRGRFGKDRGDSRPPRGGRDLPPSKFASHRPYEPTPTHAKPFEPAEPAGEPILLPGESLAKYRDRGPVASLPTEVMEAAPRVVEESHAVESSSTVEVAPAAILEERRAEVEPAIPSQLFVHQEREPVAEVPPAMQIESAPANEKPAPPFAPARLNEVIAEPHAEPHLSEEEATALAEQVAEAQQEEAEATADAEAEAAAVSAEMAEGAHENETEDAGLPDAPADSEHEDDEAIRREIFDAAGDVAEAEQAIAEAQSAEPRPPMQARVQSDSRPRFQRSFRRGAPPRRRSGGDRPHGRPQPHHGRSHQPPRKPQLISELLKAGQEIIVQIAKEPLGKKGARITSHVALPGRFLVYMPTVDHIGVSRKIGSAEERSRLRRLLHEMKGNFPGGFIVRTAASGAADDELRADVNFLGNTWQEIKNRGEERKSPALLHRDLNLVERILRDHMSKEYSAIWIDNEEEFSKVVEFVNRFQPALVSRVKLFTKPVPIFEEFGIQQEIDKSLRPKVWLKSGGYIVINHTEALVAIDVNTGKFVGKGSTRLEDTIVKTNVEAVKEIVRQIRLRDLGGIIVVDFIDMEERKNRIKVMGALEDALRDDKAPSKVLPFNEFGLVAITRKRTKQALERVLCQPCPACSGSGMVKSLPTLCYEIQAEARKMAKEMDGASLTLRVNPEIAKALKTRESGLIEELEQWTRKSVIIQGDPTLHWEQYDIY